MFKIYFVCVSFFEQNPSYSYVVSKLFININHEYNCGNWYHWVLYHREIHHIDCGRIGGLLVERFGCLAHSRRSPNE